MVTQLRSKFWVFITMWELLNWTYVEPLYYKLSLYVHDLFLEV